MSNKIELSGIFSEGYGIIPKKLMKMKIGKVKIKTQSKEITVKGITIKAVLSYFLSYTGAGNECFPSINTIASDLEISRDSVIYALRAAEEQLNLIDKQQMYPNDPLKHNNKYILKFLNSNTPNIQSKVEQHRESDGSTFEVVTLEQNNNSINNNSINNIYTQLKPIIDKWNSIETIVTHTDLVLQANLKKKHLDKVNLYGIEETKRAVENYAEIIKSDDYFFTYKWPLWDFLIRGLPKFVDEMKPFENFKSYYKEKEDKSLEGLM